jgi:hypothetical protein
VAEPYPAAIGPAFGGRPTQGGVVRFSDCNATVTCADGRSEVRACSALIDGSSNRSRSIVHTLFPSGQPPCERPVLAADAGLGGSLEYLRDLYRHSYARCTAPSPELLAWFAGHSGRAAGCPGPQRAEILWERVVIDLETRHETRELSARHVLDFSGTTEP